MLFVKLSLHLFWHFIVGSSCSSAFSTGQLAAIYTTFHCHTWMGTSLKIWCSRCHHLVHRCLTSSRRPTRIWRHQARIGPTWISQPWPQNAWSSCSSSRSWLEHTCRCQVCSPQDAGTTSLCVVTTLHSHMLHLHATPTSYSHLLHLYATATIYSYIVLQPRPWCCNYQHSSTRTRPASQDCLQDFTPDLDNLFFTVEFSQFTTWCVIICIASLLMQFASFFVFVAFCISMNFVGIGFTMFAVQLHSSYAGTVVLFSGSFEFLFCFVQCFLPVFVQHVFVSVLLHCRALFCDIVVLVAFCWGCSDWLSE